MERSCLLSLVKEIQIACKYTLYKNVPGKTKQSSVSMVLRVSPGYEKHRELNAQLNKLIQPFNFLQPEETILPYSRFLQALDTHPTARFQQIFIQRAIDPNDIHSGQLAFPGGHVDNDENDFQAAVREVKEEIGLTLDESSIYLGKLPKNFYARKTKQGESLYTSLHIFLWLPRDNPNNSEEIPTISQKSTATSDPVFIMQEKEVRDVQWIDMNKFFEADKASIKIYKFTGSFNPAMLPMFLRKYAKNAVHYFKYGEFCSIEIGMDNVLWGLTLFFMSYILSLVKMSFIGDLKGNNSSSNPALSLQNINYLLSQTNHYQIVFDPTYRLGGLINYVARRVHNTQRVQQFTYETPRMIEDQNVKKKIYLSLAGILAASAVAYPIYRCAL